MVDVVDSLLAAMVEEGFVMRGLVDLGFSRACGRLGLLESLAEEAMGDRCLSER